MTKYCIVTNGDVTSSHIQSTQEDNPRGFTIKHCGKCFLGTIHVTITVIYAYGPDIESYSMERLVSKGTFTDKFFFTLHSLQFTHTL